MKNYFAKNLKYLREKNNLSQEDLAKILNVELGAISHWENKRREPKMDMVLKIASYFNVSENMITRDLKQEEFKTNSNTVNNTQLLFDKTKDILSDDDRATIEFIMKKAINNYEKNKNNNNE